MPDHKKMKAHPYLQFLGSHLHNPSLWRLDKRSTAGAFFVGLLIAFAPVPFQMVFAASLAVLLQVNIPVSAALVWITNPLTMIPLFFFAYKVGVWILGTTAVPFKFEASWQWLSHGLLLIWQPFLLGCLVCGLATGVLGYLTIRILWRVCVMMRWRERRARKRAS